MFPEKLNVAVIGPAGMTGSYAVVELLKRGHNVTGISRHPAAVGTHERYTIRPLNFDEASISEIAEAFTGFDCIVKLPSH
jgi:putative NADH-flavin reductase